jgi:hypothetical protein
MCRYRFTYGNVTYCSLYGIDISDDECIGCKYNE